MHGDYHAANGMFSRTGREVVAIVDWEMGTIGYLLLDLGCCWRPGASRTGPAASATPSAVGGLASTDELLRRSAAMTGRDLSHITWDTVSAGFKLGIVIEGTLARAARARPRRRSAISSMRPPCTVRTGAELYRQPALSAAYSGRALVASALA